MPRTFLCVFYGFATCGVTIPECTLYYRSSMDSGICHQSRRAALVEMVVEMSVGTETKNLARHSAAGCCGRLSYSQCPLQVYVYVNDGLAELTVTAAAAAGWAAVERRVSRAMRDSR